MALPIRTRPSFPHSQSLPSGSFHKPLILICQRADRMKTTITELIKLITWTTALSNSMKPWAMPRRAPKMDGLRWRVLTKRGPLEKGMANHFSFLTLRTPWTVWKEKIRSLQSQCCEVHQRLGNVHFNKIFPSIILHWRLFKPHWYLDTHMLFIPLFPWD